MKRKRIILFFLALVLLAGGLVYWRLTIRPPLQDDELTPPPANTTQRETDEEKARRILLGIWQDEYQGKRTMTLKEDGTGTILVELSGLNAFFASKLRFDMKWRLEGKKLTKKTVGGEPADRVNVVLNLKGDTAEDTILEVTEDRLLLLDKDGKTKYDWRRVKKGE